MTNDDERVWPYSVIDLKDLAEVAGILTKVAKDARVNEDRVYFLADIMKSLLIGCTGEGSREAMTSWYDLIAEVDADDAASEGAAWLIGTVALLEVREMPLVAAECSVTRELYGFFHPVLNTEASIRRLANRLGISVQEIPDEYREPIVSAMDYYFTYYYRTQA